MATSSNSPSFAYPGLLEAKGNLKWDIGGDRFDRRTARKVEHGERD